VAHDYDRRDNGAGRRPAAGELDPDPDFFERHVADDAVIDGQQLKRRIVEAHRPGAMPKFTTVEMSDVRIVDHGSAAVVTCTGRYEGPQRSARLKFMRVWLKRGGRWQIVAGSTAPADA
jgi:hypothetical protein